MVSVLNQPIGIFAKDYAVLANENETIGYTYQFMIKYNVRHISIVNDNSELVGMIRATDILRSMINSKTANFLQIKNNEVMNSNLSYVEENAKLRDAVILMAKKDLTTLPIVKNSKLIGVLSDKQILRMDPLWKTIPDASISAIRGIGSKIYSKDIIPEKLTLWEASKQILDTKNQFILVKDEHDEFSGIVSLNKILGSIVPLLMFGGSNMQILKTRRIDTIVRETVLTRRSPALIMITRMQMINKGRESVVLYENGFPVKLVIQKDLMDHLVDFI